MSENGVIIPEGSNENSILNLFLYLDMEEAELRDGSTVSKLINELKKIYGSDYDVGLKLYQKGGNSLKEYYPSEYEEIELDEGFIDPTRNESDYQIRREYFSKILNYYEAHPEFGKLIVTNQSWEMEEFENEVGGLTAANFVDPNGEVSIIYRGTGAREWPDNGYAISSIDIQDGLLVLDADGSEQQEEAVAYFDISMDNLAKDYTLADLFIIISGHSKGGNKAQYVTINSDYRQYIDECHNFDGQGMSQEAIDYFIETYGEDDYLNSLSKMYGFFSQDDFVHVLGVTIVPEDQRYYFEGTLEKNGVQDLMKNHFPSDYLNDDGSFSDMTDQGYLAGTIVEIMDRAMELPEEDRAKVAGLAMDIMGNGEEINNKGETSLADKIDGAIIALPILMESLGGTPDGRAFLWELSGEVLINIREAGDWAVEAAVEVIAKADQKIDDLRKDAMEGIISFEKDKDDFFDNIRDELEENILSLDHGINDFLDDRRDEFVGGLENGLDGMAQGIGDAAKWFGVDKDIVNNTVNSFDALTDAGVRGINEADAWLDEVKYTTWDKLSDGNDWLDSQLENFKYGVMEDTAESINYIDDKIDSFIADSAGLISDIDDYTDEIVGDGIKEVFGFFADASFFVDKNIEKLEDEIKGLGDKTKSALDEVLDSVMDKFKGDLSEDEIKVINDVSAGGKFILDAAIKKDLLDWNLYDSFSKMAQSFVTSGLSKVRNMFNKVDTSSFTSLKRDLERDNYYVDRGVGTLASQCKTMTSQVSSEYSESYVRSDIRRINDRLSQIQRIMKQLNNEQLKKINVLEQVKDMYQDNEYRLSREFRN